MIYLYIYLQYYRDLWVSCQTNLFWSQCYGISSLSEAVAPRSRNRHVNSLTSSAILYSPWSIQVLFMDYSHGICLLAVVYSMGIAHFLAIQFLYHSWFWTQVLAPTHNDVSVIHNLFFLDRESFRNSCFCLKLNNIAHSVEKFLSTPAKDFTKREKADGLWITNLIILFLIPIFSYSGLNHET